MNHKRKRPKNARAGCLMCKGWKANGCVHPDKNMSFGDRRRFQGVLDQIRCERVDDRDER
ncbi:hypothetical protein [Bosea sp. RAC05]|uniref:hypothetical protein n=1 Tax=Bosea sp. RAC05 TaxID=1842539 RepID=UPI00083D668D|nr:hypothetical protein [Bosea sp. RAC05]AOG03421.1 hypothetical protein BSY19_4835 [Bosea sp. RAC05]